MAFEDVAAGYQANTTDWVSGCQRYAMASDLVGIDQLSPQDALIRKFECMETTSAQQVLSGVNHCLVLARMRVISSLYSLDWRVAMVGDGINDAPALARAEVGIAMGTGTDVAMGSAQVTLVQGDLAGILRARALCIATVRNMRQNLMFALTYNAMSIPLAAGMLYPLTGHFLPPMVAAMCMSVSSTCVVLNALRLNHTQISS